MTKVLIAVSVLFNAYYVLSFQSHNGTYDEYIVKLHKRIYDLEGKVERLENWEKTSR